MTVQFGLLLRGLLCSYYYSIPSSATKGGLREPNGLFSGPKYVRRTRRVNRNPRGDLLGNDNSGSDRFGNIALLAGTISIGATNVTLSIVATLLVDRIGRRWLLLVGMFAVLFTLSGAYYLSSLSGIPACSRDVDTVHRLPRPQRGTGVLADGLKIFPSASVEPQ